MKKVKSIINYIFYFIIVTGLLITLYNTQYYFFSIIKKEPIRGYIGITIMTITIAFVTVFLSSKNIRERIKLFNNS